MKIDGETFKLKTPATANDVVKDHPGHVLLDSEAVKHFGVRAKPLEPNQELKPKKIYFLVELPPVRASPEETKPLARRVRSSGIRGMNAKERLDFLMLSKRSVSGITLVKDSSSSSVDGLGLGLGPGPNREPVRVRMRLPKAQLEKLMEESHDRAEVAEKIISLYVGDNAAAGEAGGAAAAEVHKPRRKRVSFSPMEEGEIRVEAAASQ
ncbi:uncharacterized protein G2W53_013413 [Senna tora]|uniref:Plastid movement impaired 2 n=1 Tax=Senna tora TaxID=362788 RepID=A0A834WPF1_9FABA|nr:uncharacterized protein G2W53_013413 [Senna tora]